VTLAELLAAATPGPWEHRLWGTTEDEWPDRRVSVGTTTGHGAAVCISPRYGELNQSKTDARLIALAPDLARLALDMGEALRNIEEIYDLQLPAIPPLLARLDALARREARDDGWPSVGAGT
jgi:hypothetical protein